MASLSPLSHNYSMIYFGTYKVQCYYPKKNFITVETFITIRKILSAVITLRNI